MGQHTDIREELRKETATKIHGQPTDHDVMLLEKELIAIATTIPATLGGGNHGHTGLIVKQAKYLTMTGRTAFAPPGNPRIYPAGLALNAAAGTRAREEALHKELIAKYEINKGVEQALKANIKLFMSTEYAKESKQNKQTAKQLKANANKEQSESTEELIAHLTEAHTRKIKSLIKANTEATKEIMSLIKEKTIAPTNPTNSSNKEKKKKREERQKKFLTAPVCKHSGKKHPSEKEDECWELDKNAASHPASWKSTKST